MITNRTFKSTALALIFLAITANAHGAATSLSDAPLVTSSNTNVLPNLMFVLDDSGSMDWDYMPDNAKNFAGKYGFNSSQCNGTYYDPTVTYDPPIDAAGNPLNATPTSFTAAYKDGFVTSAGTVNLSTGFTGGSGSGASGNKLTAGPAFYYTYSGTQTTAAQKNYFTTSNTFYTECISAIGAAAGKNVFQKVRLATTPITTITVSSGGGSPATITLSGSSRASVTHITVNNQEILSATSTRSSTSSTVAKSIRDLINACTVAITGNCAVSGYSATASGSIVTLSGPAAAATRTPVVSCGSCGMTITATAFPSAVSTAVSSITVNGVSLLSGATASTTDTSVLAASIKTGITAAGYSATVSGSVVTITGPSSASTYTPVITTNPVSGGMTLTTDAFPESTPSKLQNFANWYSYYSNRMLMMKTGAGLAFAPVSDKYRVGFLTMNNNVSPGIAEVAPFDAAQKTIWYNKLYAANPGNSTPLREALSHVGQYYAHKFGNVTTYKATLTVGGSGSAEVDSITVNGVEIMFDTSGAQTSTSTLAASIAAQINLLDPSDFGASVSGSVVTITGTAATLGYPLVISNTGSMTTASTAFTATTVSSQLNGITPADPMQYSCQQNFTILSTDGYWNGSTTYNLANSPVGQQDGTEQRPMVDGASNSYTITTPYTTVQRRQTVTSGATTTKTWTKTVIGSACTTSSIPAGATSTAPMLDTTDGSHYVGLGVRTGASAGTNPDSTSGHCYTIGTNTGTNVTWFCRGKSNNNPVSGYRDATATDSSGVTWYLVSSGAGTSGCVKDSTNWSGGYSTTQGACPAGTGVAGNQVTTSTQSEVISGATSTSLDDYTGTQQTTQVVNNGVPGVVSSFSPATPSYSTSAHVSTAVAGATSDTCAGQDGLATPCPNAGGTWSAATGPTCVATASLPAAGTAITNTSSTGGTAGTPTVVGTTGPTAGTPSNSAVTTTAGTSNTLADVAEYYYVTDLRDNSLGNCTGAIVPPATTGGSVCTNNVRPAGSRDQASHQHMTTFTLGLGTRGKMVHSASYWTDTSGDFFSVWNGVTANGTTVCSWQSSGTCNWPTPASGAVENIDDLWHAAVNGRGDYFSATNPVSLSSGISGALATIDSNTGSSAAATTSNPNVTSGDNFVFSSTFTTTEWDGELVRQELDLTNGSLIGTTPWQAIHAYVVDDKFMQTTNGVINGYKVTAAYTSGSTFGATDTANATAISVYDWAAQALLDTKSALTAKAGSRTIYTYSSSTGNHLQAFNETNFGGNSNFNIPHISNGTDGLTQMICASPSVCATGPWQASNSYLINERFVNLGTVYQVATAYASGATFGAIDIINTTVVTTTGKDLVNFLRGDRSYEGADIDNTKYFRQRTHILGDIVNAEAVYVKASLFNYTDAGYSTFVANNINRQGIVYAAGNDGMLHAFYAANGTGITGGDEAWAYIPSLMLPNLYKLADKKYSAAGNHRYFVDGTPVVGDICPTAPATDCTGAQWKTILVGGFNKGGRGYYALDITDPASPKALWEFTNANLGYTYGNPKITRLKNGAWVVMFASGYNNIPGTPTASDGGDGVGRLYVINAATGAPITSINSNGTISTGVGDTTTPSGLAHIAVRVVDATTDNTALAVYGGDLLGNLWRFDVNGDVGDAGYDAQLLTTLKGPTGVVQPVTTKPEIGNVNGNQVVFVGTGQYLGTGDLTVVDVQSIYAIKDPLLTGTTAGTAIYANPRSLLPPSTSGAPAFINQSPTTTTCPTGSPSTICTAGQIVRTSPNNTVSFASDAGWYMDLPDAGERANTDPTLSLGTLGFTTNVPNTDACTVGGYSYRYFIDYRTGGAVSTSTTAVISTKLGNALATRPVYVRLPNGVVVELTRLSTGKTSTSQVPIGAGGSATRRTSWRELTVE